MGETGTTTLGMRRLALIRCGRCKTLTQSGWHGTVAMSLHSSPLQRLACCEKGREVELMVFSPLFGALLVEPRVDDLTCQVGRRGSFSGGLS